MFADARTIARAQDDTIDLVIEEVANDAVDVNGLVSGCCCWHACCCTSCCLL